MSDPTDLRIPDDLLPTDGRFGSGPSKIRPDAVAALAEQAEDYLGTSHRQAAVKFMVSRLRDGLSELFALPDGYEVMLGNGGTTILWDALCFGLIDHRSQHTVFGEFSSKFAAAARTTPFLDDPDVIGAEPGTVASPVGREGIDVYALTHNETSTGVMAQIVRPADADDGALVAVDATSGAAALRFDPAQSDLYYFAPQKALASDGGLWLALASPAAIERIERIAASDRWVPAGLDLGIALDNSRKDQTYNTPALATIFLAVQQVEWINGNGGLEFAASRCDDSARALYGWAESSAFATPFVQDPAARSTVVGTIDFDESVDAAAVAKALRANDVLDTEPYRKLGRNQLRIAMYPAVEPADVASLTGCIDWLVERL
jgi:phosphoserine aminotransferase